MLNTWRNVGSASVQPGADRRDQRLRLRALLGAAQLPAARIAAVEDEVGDALGMPRRVDERDRRALRDAEQREAIEARGVDDGLEVGDPGVDRELAESRSESPHPRSS